MIDFQKCPICLRYLIKFVPKSIMNDIPLYVFLIVRGSGAGGIRTLGTVLKPYNGLANHRLQPLGHSS
jgi:hypothetical protein